MARLAIVGSRNFANLDLVRSFVCRLRPTTTVVSGGARGVDTVAVEAAQARHLQTHVLPADWDRFGKSAGYKRNAQIVHSVAGLVAFWDGESRGTKHAIDLATRCKLWVRVYRPDGSLLLARN